MRYYSMIFDCQHERPGRFLAAVTNFLLALMLVCWYSCWQAPTVIVLMRHADRQGQSDALSDAGLARAEELAQIMKKLGINAIYTSEAARTQQTAAPTAELLGLTPTVIDASDVVGLVNALRTNHAGKKVLVVGHSSTLPQIIAKLGGPAVTINSNEYDTLYLLTLRCCGTRSVAFTMLQYGTALPP